MQLWLVLNTKPYTVNQSGLKFWFLAAILLAGTVRSNCQSDLPEELKQGTIPEQFKYLEEHTRIYENYRAIREDMFRMVRKNTQDTLTKANERITGLVLYNTTLKNRIDSLNKGLEVSDIDLKAMTRTKNSIRLLRLEINKNAYNTVMWSIVAALVFLLVTGFLTFKQNRLATLRTKKDLEDLKKEFEEYHTKTRLERERMNIDHFNEIKKLKEGKR